MFPLEVAKDQIEFLERELKFLDIFLNLQSSKAECDTLDVTQKAQALLHDTRVALSTLNLTSPNFYPSIYQMEDDIRLIKSEIRANYSFPKISLPLSASKNGVAISEIVPEFIGTVVCILSDLLSIYDGRSVLFVPGPMEQIVEVLEELKSLRAFVCFVAKRCKEPQSCHHDFFTHIFVVAGHAAMLVWLSLPGTDNGTQDLASGGMNALLSDHLRMRIKPIEPSIRKIYVDVLQALKSTSQSGWRPDIQNENTTNSEAGFLETVLHNLVELPTIGNATVALKDETSNLQEMLNFLRANLPCIESHFEDLHIMIIDAGILVYSLYDVASAKVSQALLDFPGNIQHFNTLVYPIVQKVFQSNLPRIHGIGYVDFLLSNLNEFQGRYSKSLVSIKNQLQIIQKELESVQPFLKDVAKELHKHHQIQHLAQLVIGTAYEVEYIVDSFISKEVPECCLERWLVDIIEEIELNSAKIDIELKKTPAVDIALHDPVDAAAAHTSSESTSPKNEEIVGFDHIISELRKKLTKGSQQLDVISIVGMGGQGKTTLANKLFNDDSVKSRFDSRAQCCVSQEYSCRSILLAILRDLSCDDPATSELSTEDLRDKLQKVCKVKRYLILIDDIWEASVWEDLQPCFADVKNGSRIILTTRQVEVANSARISCEPFHLPMFKEDESWKLLKVKVFGKEGCSPDLEKVGLEIAKKCAGLPLSIVLVAGILAKEKNERYWRQVAKNLGSHIQSDAKAVIEHSYKHLPHHLKPCFLYFGAFSEDKTINVSDLTCLWIAEGFIKIDKEKSLEDVASDYLENLIGRNLVKIAKRSSDGKVKACQIHDLLLDFCKETAEQEKLLLCIDRYQSANPPPGIYSHRQLAQRRLSIYADKNYLAKWSSSCSLVGSVLCRDDIIEYLSPTSRIFQKFKFLKVLDLRFIVVDSFPTELFYLRYFAVRTAKKSITSCISNLWNLGTLIVIGEGTDLSLPFTLWKMSKLRILHICDNAYFTISGAEELLENSSNLDNLETLSCPCFSCAEDAEFVLGKMPNIRNLRCSIKYPKGNFWVLQLEFLAQLKTLKVHFDVHSAIAGAYIFPSSLNKLTLSTISWGTGSEIAMLPNLQVLKLVNVKFDKREWTVNDNEFPKLKVLKVVNSDNFKEWNVLDDAFPCLEHLTLHKCQYLKEIPSWFAEIASLKFVRVRSCNVAALVASLKEIRTMQVEDYQRSEFQIIFG
ncbi:late blight resistance protein R1-A [Nicotiana tabacum]|uniref:Late blight resistance protein R1-A n=2 Tax=Nicotiana tabacum TaxID=4097 RepID=A0AC58TJ46_TOBAC